MEQENLNTKETTNSDLGAVSRSYLLLREVNAGLHGASQTFEAEILSEINFNAYKSHNFKDLSEWVLKNNRKVFIIDVNKPLIKIIPEVTVVNNCD
jgi:hypothetical protein